MTTKTDTEQLRAEFEAWLEGSIYSDDSETFHTDLWSAYQAGRAALQSQDREDVKRLDWLDKTAHCADWMEDEPTKRVIRAHDGAEFTGDTWREAIDHARRAEGDASGH